MSGHSKWRTIKRKKAATDARRGKVFSRIIKEITVAARFGGGDEEANPRLRTAIQAAKSVNMPQANIERAVKRGTGEIPGESYEESTYEGYGPGGVAIIVEVLTDNKNRTVAEIRHIFSKNNGNLAGSVAWMFKSKGLISVDKEKVSEDDLIMIALDAGADDIDSEGDNYEIVAPVESFENVKKSLEESDIPYEHFEITRLPQSTVEVKGKEAEQVLKLLESLEDHDDVQKVYSNFDIDIEELKALAAD